jgi:hypothetical protein
MVHGQQTVKEGRRKAVKVLPGQPSAYNHDHLHEENESLMFASGDAKGSFVRSDSLRLARYANSILWLSPSPLVYLIRSSDLPSRLPCKISKPFVIYELRCQVPLWDSTKLHGIQSHCPIFTSRLPVEVGFSQTGPNDRATCALTALWMQGSVVGSVQGRGAWESTSLHCS